MSSLSSKSAQEIHELLDEYGIKHGPVVGEWLKLNCLLCINVQLTNYTGLFLSCYLCQLTMSAPVVVFAFLWFSVHLCSLGLMFTLVWHLLCLESTRSLYEKKLREAMAKGKRAKPSPDKTYYREEGNSFSLFSSTSKALPCKSANIHMYSKGWKKSHVFLYCNYILFHI